MPRLYHRPQQNVAERVGRSGGGQVLSGIRNPRIWILLAIFMSGASLAVSALAFIRAGEHQAIATGELGASTEAPTNATATTASTPTDEPTVGPDETEDGTEEPLVTALPSTSASYTLIREDVQLRLVGQRYVDLDQPLVNATNTAYDVEYDSGSALSQPELSFESIDVAVGKSPTVTPNECAQAIQYSPIDDQVELSQDLVLCAVTNGIGAVNEPARTKMARIVVNSISKDNVANLTVTTWEIPR